MISSSILATGNCLCLRILPLILPCWLCGDFDGLGNIRNSRGVDTDIRSYCTMTGTNDCPPEMNPPQIFVERTLAMLKPDVAHRETEIEDAILRAGFTIIQKRRVHLTPEQASDFYAEHFGKMFFPSLVAFMSSGPIVAMVLARENAISQWREVIGPTNSNKAREMNPDSLRAIFGTDDQRNALHGSDGYSSAEREIRFFFPDSIIEPISVGQAARDYLAKSVNPTLIKGLTELCRQKPGDPVIWLADWFLNNNPYKPKVRDFEPVVVEP